MRELIRLAPKGRIRVLERRASGLWLGDWTNNTTLKEAAAIEVRALSGVAGYKLGVMYIEFENALDPDAPIEGPSFGTDPEDAAAYYQSLADSADRDYVRAEVIASEIDSADETYYPRGNRLTLTAFAVAAVGAHGKPFGEAHGSRMFGAAVVASPDEGDPTLDLVYARAYLPDAKQRKKLSTGQLGVRWQLTFEK